MFALAYWLTNFWPAGGYATEHPYGATTLIWFALTFVTGFLWVIALIGAAFYDTRQAKVAL